MSVSLRGARLLAISLLFGSLLLTGCGRDPERPLRIGTNVWIGSEPLYLARDLGRLDPKRVRLAEYPSASEVLRAFRNEALDGMVISLDELLGLAADGLSARAVLVVDVSNGADAVVGRPGMRSMRDLRGRVIAVESGAVGALVLSRALALEGMESSEIEVIHLDSNEQPEAFERGRIDGAVTFDPYRTRLLQAGATTLFDSTRIPGEIVDLIAVRADVVAHQPRALETLIRGWFEAVDYIARDPLDAAQRMAVRQQSGAEEFLGALRLLHLPTREENLMMLAGPTPALVANAARLAALMRETGLLSVEPTIDGLLDSRPLAALEGSHTRTAPSKPCRCACRSRSN